MPARGIAKNKNAKALYPGIPVTLINITEAICDRIRSSME